MLEDKDDYDNNDYNDNDSYYQSWTLDTCPPTALDMGSENANSDWVTSCENILNQSQISSQTPNAAVATKLAPEMLKASGGGMDQGMTVLIDSLNCGWMPSSVFDGIKVSILAFFQGSCRQALLLILGFMEPNTCFHEAIYCSLTAAL